MKINKYQLRRRLAGLRCLLFGHSVRSIKEPERSDTNRIWLVERCDRCRSVLNVEPLGG